MEKKLSSLNFTVKAVDAAKYQLRGVFSTADEDRHGEIIDQKGWKLDNFLQNPVILWGHDQYQPAIGKAIDLGFEDGQLVGTIQFAAEEYDFAKTIYNLYAGGYLRAFSVGFMNTKWQYDEATEQFILLENELYEISCVNVPANAMALAKSKGIDVAPLEQRKERADQMTAKILGKKTEEEPAPVEPEKKEDEVEEGGEDTVKAAVETILKASPTEIKSAVEQLTEKSKDADEKGKVEHTPVKPQDRKGRKGYSVDEVNRAIRSLIKASKK